MDFLAFCFQSFWHFIGVGLLIGITGEAIEGMFTINIKK
jgi:hypothetical protein